MTSTATSSLLGPPDAAPEAIAAQSARGSDSCSQSTRRRSRPASSGSPRTSAAPSVTSTMRLPGSSGMRRSWKTAARNAPTGGSPSTSSSRAVPSGPTTIGGRCPALTSAQLGVLRVEHDVGERRQLGRADGGEHPVEQVDHLLRLVALERVRAQRGADLRHQRAGLHPAPDDVADHERDPAAPELEHVVPVAAHAGVDRGRAVGGRERDAGDDRQRGGQHRPLHRLDDVALRVQAGVLDRDRGTVGGELQQVASRARRSGGARASPRAAPRSRAPRRAAARRAASGCPSRAGSG